MTPPHGTLWSTAAAAATVLGYVATLLQSPIARADPAVASVPSDDPTPTDANTSSDSDPNTNTDSDPNTDSAEANVEDAATESEPATPPNEQEAATLFREGSMFYELGQYEEAIHSFESAWKLAPAPQLLFNLGQAHRRWHEVDPEIDHLRRAKTFFINYDKRMQTEPSYGAREADYVQNIVEKLEAQIELEEAKEAERNRVVATGPSAAELEALERRRLERDQQLATSRRLNGSGIALIVSGSLAAAVGVGGVLARVAYGVLLESTATDDPNAPSLATAEEDEQRRDGYLLAGQIGFGGLIAAAALLPVGVGLRVGGMLLERRALGGARANPRPKVAVQTTPFGLTVQF